MEKEFDWEYLTVLFPEFFNSFEVEKNEFLEEPVFHNGTVKFKLEDFLVDLNLAQMKPSWIKSDEIDKAYHKISEEIYNRVSSELEQSLDELREIQDLSRKVKEQDDQSSLNTHVSMENSLDRVGIYDYYSFFPNPGNKPNSPTDFLEEIKNIPKELLSPSAREYQKLAQNTWKGKERKSGIIYGKTILEALENTDKIYKLAPTFKKISRDF